MRPLYGLGGPLLATAPPVVYAPTFYSLRVFPGVVAGVFAQPPRGVILHGSRSGVLGNPQDAEFVGTARYAVDEPDGLGWNATIGSDAIAEHMLASQWGWNARGCSSLYVGVEFAQANVWDAIDDGQVRAFAWYFRRLRDTWPQLPRLFPTHAELDGTPEYGTHDGKTDVFPRGSAQADELRRRIAARLDSLGVV